MLIYDRRSADTSDALPTPRRCQVNILPVLLLFLAFIVACAAGLPGNAQAAGTTATFSVAGTRDYAQAFAVLTLVNQQRAAVGATALKMDTSMLETAMNRAAETEVYWDHVRPNGTSCFTAFPAGNTSYGENIAAGQVDAASVMTSWMNSQGHKDNILNTGYTVIGIGCFYQGTTKYWVQCFGNKSPVVPAQPANATFITPVEVLKTDCSLQLGNQMVGTTSHYVLGVTTSKAWPTGAYTSVDPSCLTFSSSNTAAATIDSTGLLAQGSAGGTTTISATLKSDSSVSASQTLSVARSVSLLTISTIGAQIYTGTARMPAPVVTDGSKTLASDVDYTLAYTDNLNIGTASITITGKGSYTGSRVITFSIIPATPTLTGLVNSPTGPKLSWSTIAGATGYRVYRKTATVGWTLIKTVTPGSAVAYVDTTAASGTTYTYTVRAQGGTTGIVGGYDTLGLTLVCVATPKLVATVNSTAGVKVSWSAVPGATGYYVYRKTATVGWTRIATIASGSTVSCVDATVVSGTTYTYTVRAIVTSSANISSYDAKGKSVAFLTAPKLSSLTNSASGPVLKWTKVSGATGYYLYRKTTGSWTRIATIASGSTVSYIDRTATTGVTYTYTIRAWQTSSANISSYYASGWKITVKR